jgi:hypothetical protein
MTTLKPHTTLTKTFHTGTVSKWVFGQLSSGHFGAKNQSGKKKIYTSLTEMENSIQSFKSLGYSNPGSDLIKQLSLAI